MTNLPNNNQMVKIGQAAKILGVSIDTLRRWERAGKITTIRTPLGTRLYPLNQLRQIRGDSLTPPTTTLDWWENLKKEAQKHQTSIQLPISLSKKLQKVSNYSRIFLIAVVAVTIGTMTGIFLSSLPQGTPTPTAPQISQLPDLPGVERIGQIRSVTDNVKSATAEVLAAETIPSFLEINIDTAINGDLAVSSEGIFGKAVIAPNLIYSITGGANIAVTSGQNPTISSTDTLASVTARGATTTIPVTLSGGAKLGNLLDLGQLSSEPSSPSNGSVYYNTSSNKFRCYQNGAWKDCDTDTTGGSMSSFTLAGSSGTSQTISDGNTLTIAADNGLTTTAASTDKVTVGLDVTTTSTDTTATANSGLVVTSSGLSLLRSCSNSQVLQWDATNVYWKCADSGSISGSGTSGRIAYWSGTSSLSSNANFINFSTTLFSNVGQISLGSAVQSTATAFVVVDNPVMTATANQNFYKMFIDNNAAVTVPTGTATTVATLALDEPNITETGTVTNATTLYISGAPTEGNTDSNFAIWVDDGETRFENTPVSGSITGRALTVVPTYVVEATDITLSGIRVALDTNSNTDSGDVAYGVNVDDITTTSGPTEYGMRIGSGYDYQFYFELGTRDLRISATAPSAGTSPLTATIPAVAADDTFCMATLGNCFGGGGGSGVTYTSQTTNAITKFTSTTGQITSSSLTDNGTTLTLAANLSLTMTEGTGSITANFSPVGSTSTARAITSTPKFGIDATDQTLSGVYVNPNTNTNTDTGDVLNGILIDTITASDATEYGLQIASGWDANVYLNDTTSIIRLAGGGNIVIQDNDATPNTLCTITDAGSTGNLSCTGSITGGSSGIQGYWSRTSTTLSPATANDIVSIANTTTTGSDLAITNTGIYTGTGLAAITANSATTGDIFTISATGLTSGDAFKITGPSSTGVISGTSAGLVSIASDVGSAGTEGSLLYLAPDFSAGSATTGNGIKNVATDSTAIGNTDYGYYGSLALTGNAAKTGTGIYSTVTSTSTTADTLYGADILVDHNAANSSGNKALYGIRSQVTNDGFTDSAGNNDAYGGYFSAVGNSGGNSTASGVYAVASGGDDAYAFWAGINGPTNDGGLLLQAPSNVTIPTNFRGVYVNLSSNSTTDASSANNHTGVDVLQDLLSFSSGSNTQTLKGFKTTATSVTTSGTYTGTVNWYGYDVTIPSLTQVSGSTINAYGLNVTTGSITTGGTQYGVNVAASGVGAGTLNGVNISGITGGAGTETALSIGSGWDDAINVNSGQAIIETTGVVSVGLDNTATTNGLCHSGANVDVATDATRDIVACSAAPADYAEWYETESNVESADVVAITDKVFTYQASQSDPFTGIVSEDKVTRSVPILAKATKTDNSLVLGIVSTSPIEVIGSDIKEQSTHPLPIALNGRVPVKVSTENGPVEIGDYLTSSSTPGVSMKATKPGQVIGKALEAFTCRPELDSGSNGIPNQVRNDKGCQGKIMVFVNLSYADPLALLAQTLEKISFDDQGNLKVAGIKTDKIMLSEPTPASPNNTFDLAAKIASLEQGLTDLQKKLTGQQEQIPQPSSTPVTQEPQASSSAQIALLENLALSSAEASESTPSTSLRVNPSADIAVVEASSSTEASPSAELALTAPEELIATQSAKLASLEVTQITSTLDLNVSGVLKSLGESYLGKTILAGDLIQDGTLSITNGSEINALPTLYIQNQPLTQLVNFFNGQLTIDQKGNLVAQSILASEYKGISGKTLGGGKILAGEKSSEITTPLVKPNSRILLTPTTSTTQILAVTGKVSGEKFTVSIPLPAPQEITFDWWIVNEAN